LLSLAKRGLDTTVSFFGEEDMARNRCKNCYACVDVCPVSALLIKNNPDEDYGEVLKDDKGKC